MPKNKAYSKTNRKLCHPMTINNSEKNIRAQPNGAFLQKQIIKINGQPF